MKIRNKKAYAKVIEDSLTVGKLKQLLNKYPDDMLIGVVGHFGEIYTLDDGNFYTNSAGYLTRNCRWREKPIADNVEILEIMLPYIGPEPD